MRKVRFYFNEVNAYLSMKELIGAIILAVSVCSAPFILKAILISAGL